MLTNIFYGEISPPFPNSNGDLAKYIEIWARMSNYIILFGV